MAIEIDQIWNGKVQTLKANAGPLKYLEENIVCKKKRKKAIEVVNFKKGKNLTVKIKCKAKLSSLLYRGDWVLKNRKDSLSRQI